MTKKITQNYTFYVDKLHECVMINSSSNQATKNKLYDDASGRDCQGMICFTCLFNYALIVHERVINVNNLMNKLQRRVKR